MYIILLMEYRIRSDVWTREFNLLCFDWIEILPFGWAHVTWSGVYSYFLFYKQYSQITSHLKFCFCFIFVSIILPYSPWAELTCLPLTWQVLIEFLTIIKISQLNELILLVIVTSSVDTLTLAYGGRWTFLIYVCI